MSVFRDLLMSIKKDNDVRLTYLQSTGTQYIDTGITLTANSKFDLTFELPQKYSYIAVFGTNDYRTISDSTPVHYVKYVNSYGLYYQYNSSNAARWGDARTATYPLSIKLEVRGNTAYFKNPQNTSQVYYTFSNNTRSGNDYASCPLFCTYVWENGQNYEIQFGGNDGSSVKISDLTIYDDNDINVITHHFIPVLHEGTPCMKDEITGQYYYNLGTGDFLYDAPHTEINYIQTTGSQAIDTGITANGGYSFEFEFERTQHNNYGNILIVADQPVSTYVIDYANNDIIYYYTFNKGGNTNQHITSSDNTRYKVKYENDRTNVKLYINNNLEKTWNYYAYTSELTTHFAGPVSSTGNMTYGKYYYLKIWDENDSLVRDMIPVLKNGVACMYDKVSGNYFYDKYGGTFSWG